MLRPDKQSVRAYRPLLNGRASRNTRPTVVFVAPAVLAVAVAVSLPAASGAVPDQSDSGTRVAVANSVGWPGGPATVDTVDTGISKVKSGKAVIRAAMPALATDHEKLRLSLDGFRVEGDPRLVPQALDEVLAPWRGRTLSFTEYEQALHAVAAYLRTHGHPDAQVRMSRALVGAGTVMIAVEGLSQSQPVMASAVVTPKIDVRRFKFSGVTLVAESELQAIVAGLSGQQLTAAELESAARMVADHLRTKGYPLVQAYLPEQRVDSGEIEIAVQEGRLDGAVGHAGVTVSTKAERVKAEVIEKLLLRGAKSGEALQVADLERAVLLASDVPGIKNLTTQIEPGSQPGTTQLKATVEESRLATGQVTLDNYGSTYTGESRLLAQAQLNSPMGYGEQFDVTAVSSSLMHSIRVGVQALAGSNGLKLGAAYSSLRAGLGLDMTQFGLSNDADVSTVSATYPWIRSASSNVSFAITQDRKRFITDLDTGRENDRKIVLTTLGASGDFIDALGGQTRWSAGAGFGNLDLSGQPLFADTDAKTANTQGSFTKFNWQATRLAAFPQNKQWTWLLGLSGQNASGNLDSAEKFQLGGPTGVRAYPVGEGLGDKGWLATLELRYRLTGVTGMNAQLFGFYDAGSVDQYVNPWQAMANNSYSLHAAGLGASLAIGDAGEVKFMLARKIGSNPNASPAGNDADGQNKNTRLWIVGNIVF